MIEFRNVSKTYDTGTEAVHNANFKIDKGEFAFLVGSSGSGKSTLIKLILKEEEPTSGNIIINGNLDETALIDLSKKVSSMKKAPENINISVTNADSVDLNSFYTEGLTLTSTINTKSKSADISSFKKSELTKDYEMKVSDYKYGDIENTDKTAIINI